MANPSRKKTSAQASQEGFHANVTWKNAGIPIVLALGIFIAFVTLSNHDSTPIPNYKPTIWKTNNSAAIFATTTVSPDLPKGTYEAIIRDILKKHFPSGTRAKYGNIWVFDDVAAEKLQHMPLDVELTNQQDAYYQEHLKAMATVHDGMIARIAEYD